MTDQPERFLAAEIIREKAIQVMYHEVPYALAVIVEKFEELPKLLRIEATMNVERDSQKKILIGHKGEMLKKIGTEARKELEKLVWYEDVSGVVCESGAGLARESAEGPRAGLAFPIGRIERRDCAEVAVG